MGHERAIGETGASLCVVDPARGAMTPVLSQFLLVVGVLLFVSFDGHLLLVGALADSFRWAPVGQVAAFGPDQALQLAGWAARIFESGLVIALPAVVALLAVNIGMGIVSRAAPQLNLFAVGFPAALLAGIVLLAIAAPVLGEGINTALGAGLDEARRLTLGG